MTERQMINGLVHATPGISDDKFFAEIDKHGGWRMDYKFIGFEHTDSRAAGFTNSPNGNGWWTVVASRDDYLIWKLSPEAKQQIIEGVMRSAFISLRQNVQIKNYRGYSVAFREAKA